MPFEEIFTIGEIAKMFKVPSSTIRYWEEQKLITSKRNAENDYRVFDFQTILDLSDIIFYRDLNVPVKQMIHFHQNPPEKILDLLNETEEVTLQQLNELRRKRAGIKKRKEQLNELLTLKKEEFILETPDIEKIIPFDLKDSDEVKIYMENPGNSAIFSDTTNNNQISYGLLVPEKHFAQEEVLWNAKTSGTYYKFLLLIKADGSNETNLAKKKALLTAKGIRHGHVLGRYLATATDEAGVQMDYYKAWIKIL